jgi:hypothetical protein
MTAKMYYDNDAESSDGWRRGAPPPTSESEQQFDAEGGHSREAEFE